MLLNNNRGLDFELGPRKYTLNVSVTDNYFTVYGTLTIDITEVNEDPYFTNLPSEVTVDEHHSGQVFQVKADDEDNGDKAALKLVNADPASPFVFDEKSGMV